jgi:hypothetical protein
MSATTDKQIGDVGDQAVAEHVKAELTHRRVSDLRRVGAPPFRRRRGLADPADGHAQQVVERAHPLGVAAGQVIVHRHHVHRPATQRIPGGGERTAQGLALTGGRCAAASPVPATTISLAIVGILVLT